VKKMWKTDKELFEFARKELFTAVVGDVMDKVGLCQQFLPPQIRPLSPEMVVVGRAMTVLEADVFSETDGGRVNRRLQQPFGLMLEALDDLKPNEVYICTGSSPRYALWGELMSTRAIRLGAVGAVVDGYSRDSKGILRLKFPTFSYGGYAQDTSVRGKVIDFRTPLQIGQVRVVTQDIVFGDIDGVCVVPSRAAQEVFTRALEKVRGEKTVQKALQNGMCARRAFAKYGIM